MSVPRTYVTVQNASVCRTTKPFMTFGHDLDTTLELGLKQKELGRSLEGHKVPQILRGFLNPFRRPVDNPAAFATQRQGVRRSDGIHGFGQC